MLKEVAHIHYRRFLFSVDENFLSKNVILDSDINYFIQCPQNTNNALSEFYTLLIDLSQPLEAIRENVYHRTLTEISSFLTNQQYEHEVLYHPTDKELNSFIALFNVFAREKKIRQAETYRLKAYNKYGILAISFIKQNGKILFANFYRLTKERAANLSSFSVNQTGETFSSSHLGRAHRTLHWLDILEFKKAGARYYDFCGWYEGDSDRDLLNVNKFKEQFTKNKVKEYSGVIYKNPLLNLLLKLIR